MKQLVELQNGSIHVESQPGTGSTFTVSLPLIPATEVIDERSVFTEEKLQAMASSLRGLRILIADDNLFNQMIAKDDLEYHIKNVQISTVETGSQAVEYFQSEQVDLILMDVQMPEMDGIEATLKIRGLESQAQTSSPIPIIAMTASLMKSEIKKCYEVGSTSYISKPYKIKDLIGEVYKCYTGN